MDYLKPKKALGQHFLKDKNIAQKIVKSLHLDNINTLLELGPGKGILSQYLKNIDNIDFKMIEIDSEAIQYLEKNLPEVKKQIIQDDFLKINMEVFHKPIALIGNFPY